MSKVFTQKLTASITMSMWELCLCGILSGCRGFRIVGDQINEAPDCPHCPAIQETFFLHLHVIQNMTMEIPIVPHTENKCDLFMVHLTVTNVSWFIYHWDIKTTNKTNKVVFYLSLHNCCSVWCGLFKLLFVWSLYLCTKKINQNAWIIISSQYVHNFIQWRNQSWFYVGYL